MTTHNSYEGKNVAKRATVKLLTTKTKPKAEVIDLHGEDSDYVPRSLVAAVSSPQTTPPLVILIDDRERS